jgi:sugar phosphate permease
VATLLILRLRRISKLEDQNTHSNCEPTRPEKDKISFSDYKDGLGKLLKDRLVMGLCIMSGLRNMAQAGMMVFLPLYLADIMGMSTIMMGLALFLFQASGVIAAPIAGAISDKKGRRPVVMGGLFISTIILIGLVFTTSDIVYIVGITLMGFFLFALRPVVHSWMMDVTPQSMGGSATSLMFGVQSLFAFIAPALGGILADQYGLIAAFHLITGALLAANLVLLWLPKEK